MHRKMIALQSQLAAIIPYLHPIVRMSVLFEKIALAPSPLDEGRYYISPFPLWGKVRMGAKLGQTT